jgi:hypothetical protein
VDTAIYEPSLSCPNDKRKRGERSPTTLIPQQTDPVGVSSQNENCSKVLDFYFAVLFLYRGGFIGRSSGIEVSGEVWPMLASILLFDPLRPHAYPSLGTYVFKEAVHRQPWKLEPLFSSSNHLLGRA